ncbi:uncharacterized protein LOC132608099 [Lycium barbarum]|uniref:uncharacterized protein LOC132608099 n=1 Tax=Lycium barbarum TaxID=112863 RepID=UPI00293F1919|nr:uncharacterized protein LOC132608099 [Lycium barbarum]
MYGSPVAIAQSWPSQEPYHVVPNQQRRNGRYCSDIVYLRRDDVGVERLKYPILVPSTGDGTSGWQLHPHRILAETYDAAVDESNHQGILGNKPTETVHVNSHGSSSRERDISEPPIGRNPPYGNGFSAKVEFPYFEGVDPCSWLRKCNRYFQYHNITDPQQKLESAVLHLNGKAESWFFSYHVSKGRVSWSEFTEEICKRFEGSENSKLNLIREFKKIEQKGTVDEYLEKFEELKTWVLIRNPSIPEEFFLEFFIEGLKDDIRHTVKLLDPYSFSKAIEKARHQENTIEAQIKKGRNQWSRTTVPSNSSQWGNTSTMTSYRNGGTNSGGNQRDKLFETRRAQGLCYKCGEKYHQGHVCRPKQLNAMDAYMESGEEGQDGVIGEQVEEQMEIPEEEIIEGTISLNALSGTEVPNTISLRGEAKKNKLTLLVDSGSTHSFLDMETAKKVGCHIKEASTMRVTVANGGHLMSRYCCPNFKWKIQGIEFEDTFRILKLGGNDMVLGGDWMRAHNPVLLDFEEYKIQVSHKGKRVELKGIYHQAELKVMTANGVKQLCKKGQAIWAHLFTLSATKAQEEKNIPEDIAQILEQFPDVFLEPTSLPPRRQHDHYIPLKPDSAPVSIRPYRYNFFQKNEIEKQVKDMVQNGIIQPSHSPFSSPVLLVKNKDGS